MLHTIITKTKLHADSFMLVFLVILILGFFWREVSMQGVFFGVDEIGSDIINHTYTYRQFFVPYLKAGKIPLWNPYIGSGLPVPGEAQTGMFYPLAAILYFFLPISVAFNWVVISAFLVMAVGTYIYARSIGHSTVAAFFAAMAYTLSGFMVGHLRHVSILSAISVMPLQFYVTERLIRKPTYLWMCLLSLLIFITFSSGHLTSSYLVIFFLSVYFIIRARSVFAERKQESLRLVGSYFLALILGLLLSAAILVPAIEMVGNSTRVGTTLESALNPPYRLRFLLEFLLPYAYGDPARGTWNIATESYWENIGYIGVLPLGFALYGLWVGVKKKNKYIQCFGLLLLGSLLLLLGSHTQVYQTVRSWVPGFSFTRVPGRFLLFVDFALGILAGWGVTFIQQAKKLKQFRKWLIIGLVVTAIDLFYFGYHFNSVMPTTYFSETSTVKFLRQDKDLYRVFSVDFDQAWLDAWKKSSGWVGDLSRYINERELLPPDYNSVYQIASPTFVYGAAGRYGVRRPIELDTLVRESINNNLPRTAILLGILNVKYILASKPMDFPDLILAATLPIPTSNLNTYVYKNLRWLPRAYFISQAQLIEARDDIFNTLMFTNFDPAHAVIIENPQDNKNIGNTGRVTINEYHDTEVRLSVDSDKGGYVVLSDTDYPGWKAIVDSHAVPIYKANYAYRAVYVGPGKHTIYFNYDPLSVKIGIYISLITLVGLVGVQTSFIIKKAYLRATIARLPSGRVKET